MHPTWHPNGDSNPIAGMNGLLTVQISIAGNPNCRGFRVLEAGFVLIAIAEVGADVIDYVRHLLIAQHAPERRHGFAAIDDHDNGKRRRREVWVAGQCRIRTRTRSPFGIGHMTALADGFEHGLAVFGGKGRTRGLRAGGAGTQGEDDHSAGEDLFHDAAHIITRLCRRLMASRPDNNAPSCHAGNREACSPANMKRPSMAQRLS
jgi:hypothetical protein